MDIRKKTDPIFEKTIINREIGKKAIYGGLFLGGGGGGSLAGGLEVLEQALKHGVIKLSTIEEFDKDDIIVTASLVGSPASKEKFIGENHYGQVYELFNKIYDGEIAGIMTNEMGAQAVTNGWIAAAMTGLPFLSSACNGRAHPTGAMGSMGLSTKRDYVTLQAGLGGKGVRETSIVTEGSIKATSELIVRGSMEAGGFLTVLRNPASIDYLKDNAAINCLNHAIDVGQVFMDNLGNPDEIVSGLEKLLDLEFVCQGQISQYDLITKDGLDVGSLCVEGQEGSHDLTFWNEYISFDHEGQRLASFPDLIAILDSESGLPIISAELELGRNVILVNVKKEKIILGKSMYDMDLLSQVEQVIGIDLVKYY